MITRWTIAIDPGFGQTGILLLRGKEIKEFAVLGCGPGDPPFVRAISLVAQARDLMLEWILRYDIRRLDTCIERPVWKRNAVSFELQWRLVQQFEAEIWTYIAHAEGIRLWVTEVGPTQSKKLATDDGGASKIKVAEASPFRREHFTNQETWTTLGDTWAHSLAAWGKCEECLRVCYTDVKPQEVDEYDA